MISHATRAKAAQQALFSGRPLPLRPISHYQLEVFYGTFSLVLCFSYERVNAWHRIKSDSLFVCVASNTTFRVQ